MKNSTSLMVSLIAGAVIGALATYTLAPQTTSGAATEQTAKSAEKKPLYWQAPMNPNYKRDKPGKSPMGMDLIPVYADGAGGDDAGPGTIKVDPNVVNNLGVTTAHVTLGQLHTQINTVGYVEYDEDKLVHVHPRVSGWIDKLYVKAQGDEVVKGAPLYEIYSPELVNAQEELLIALDRKSNRLISAAKARLKSLQLPQQAIDKLLKTKQVQQNVLYRAPQSGVVEMLNIREGFFVKPGSPILAIGDLSQVWVNAEVFERQASLVKTGDSVDMMLDYLPGKKWQGKVDYVYPTLDNKTRTVKVRLRFDNPNLLFKPNMFAQINIHTDGQGDQLIVPKSALIRTGSQDRVVLALGEGKYKSIAVQVGQLDDKYAEILSGLEQGDSIVTSAQFLLDSESSKSSDFIRMNHESANNMQGMDHSSMAGMNHSKMQGMDHSSMAGMDHSKMQGMDHSSMAGMDHSKMQGMDHSSMAGMDHSKMQGMDHSSMAGMDHSKMQGMDMNDDSTAVSRADSHGVITSLMAEHGMISINRDAIEKWDKPAANVDFMSDKNVDLTSFNTGDEVNFTFEIRDGEFIVTKITKVINQGAQ